jgi:hypothetical protein
VRNRSLIVLFLVALPVLWATPPFAQSLSERIDEIVYLFYEAYGRTAADRELKAGREQVESLLVAGWTIEETERLVWRILNNDEEAGAASFEDLVARRAAEWGKPGPGGWSETAPGTVVEDPGAATPETVAPQVEITVLSPADTDAPAVVEIEEHPSDVVEVVSLPESGAPAPTPQPEAPPADLDRPDSGSAAEPSAGDGASEPGVAPDPEPPSTDPATTAGADDLPPPSTEAAIEDPEPPASSTASRDDRPADAEPSSPSEGGGPLEPSPLDTPATVGKEEPPGSDPGSEAAPSEVPESSPPTPPLAALPSQPDPQDRSGGRAGEGAAGATDASASTSATAALPGLVAPARVLAPTPTQDIDWRDSSDPCALVGQAPPTGQSASLAGFLLADLCDPERLTALLPVGGYDGRKGRVPRKVWRLMEKSKAKKLVKAAAILARYEDPIAYEHLTLIHEALQARHWETKRGTVRETTKFLGVLNKRPSELRMSLVAKIMLAERDEGLSDVARKVLSDRADRRFAPVALAAVLKPDLPIRKEGGRLFKAWAEPELLSTVQAVADLRDPVVHPYIMAALRSIEDQKRKRGD